MSHAAPSSVHASEHWLYVYYRVPEALLSDACAQAAELFEAVMVNCMAEQATHTEIRPRLLRRPELRDGDITLMEVYGPLNLQLLQNLQRALSEQLSATSPTQKSSSATASTSGPRYPLLSSLPRHTEHFCTLGTSLPLKTGPAPCA